MLMGVHVPTCAASDASGFGPSERSEAGTMACEDAASGCADSLSASTTTGLRKKCASSASHPLTTEPTVDSGATHSSPRKARRATGSSVARPGPFALYVLANFSTTREKATFSGSCICDDVRVSPRVIRDVECAHLERGVVGLHTFGVVHVDCAAGHVDHKKGHAHLGPNRSTKSTSELEGAPVRAVTPLDTWSRCSA